MADGVRLDARGDKRRGRAWSRANVSAGAVSRAQDAPDAARARRVTVDARDHSGNRRNLDRRRGGSRIAPRAGDPVTPELKRRGLRATAIAAGIVATLFYLAFAWWNSDAQNYAAITALFKPPKLALTIVDGNRLAIRPSPTDKAWLKYKVMDGIVPDHGHLMHLFLVHAPALDRIWHLHPTRQPDGSFVAALPSIEPGNLQRVRGHRGPIRISMDAGRLDRFAADKRHAAER